MFKITVTDVWTLVSELPVSIRASSSGVGAISFNTEASDVDAVKYGRSELFMGERIAQVDSNVSTYVKAAVPGEWILEVTQSGEGQFLKGADIGTGPQGATEIRTSRYAARGGHDAFGKSRVSLASTIFDAKMTYDIPEEYDQLIANGALITYVPDLSGALLSVTSDADSRAVLQGTEYSIYRPPNSHDIRMTYGNLTLPGGSEFRAGYYDDENGVFVKYVGSIVSMVLRTSITGSPSDAAEVPQSEWNIDKMDGKGPSRMTLDPSGRQIFAPDLEWLSTGTLQVGFFIDREFIPVHSYDFANTPGAAYMATGDLPIRWELLGDGTNAASVMAQGGSVQTSGSRITRGKPFGIKSGLKAVTITETLLVAIRPATTHKGKPNHVHIELPTVLVSSASEVIEVVVRYNPTLDETGWAALDADSATEVSTTAVFTPGSGRDVGGFPVSAGSQGQGVPEDNSNPGFKGKLPFTLHLDGSVDEIAITARVVDGAGTSDTFLRATVIERQ